MRFGGDWTPYSWSDKVIGSLQMELQQKPTSSNIFLPELFFGKTLLEPSKVSGKLYASQMLHV